MSKNPHGKPPSQRQLRVGEIVRHAMTELFQRGGVPDPLIEKTAITISEVAMSSDLKMATAYVAALGVRDMAPVIKALNANIKSIRGRLTPALKQMRYMPAIHFLADTSFDNYDNIVRLLKDPQVSRDLAQDDLGEE